LYCSLGRTLEVRGTLTQSTHSSFDNQQVADTKLTKLHQVQWLLRLMAECDILENEDVKGGRGKEGIVNCNFKTIYIFVKLTDNLE